MKKTEQPQPTAQQLTAHQLWCNEIQAKIEQILWPKRIRTGRHLIQMTKAEVRRQAEEVISVVVDFENTRLRVIVDAIINKLEASTAQINSIKEEFTKTKLWQFRKRSKIRIELHRSEAIQDAYQQSVLILVNTKPPHPPACQCDICEPHAPGIVTTVNDVKPQMAVN